MSVDNVKTTNGSRPELAALEVNAPVGYIGSRILPPVRFYGKAGTVLTY